MQPLEQYNLGPLKLTGFKVCGHCGRLRMSAAV